MNKNYKSKNNNIKPSIQTKQTKPIIKQTKQIKPSKQTNTSKKSIIKIEGYDDLDINHDELKSSSNYNFDTDDEYKYDEEELNKLLNDDYLQTQQTQSEPVSQPQPQQTQVDLTQMFKIFEQIFNNPKQQTYSQSTSLDDGIVNIRKKSIMANFESQIKKQLKDIVKTSVKTNKYNKTNEEIEIIERIEEEEENYIEQQHETILKLNAITVAIESDTTFIGLSKDELFEELKFVPNQEDFDDFCKELGYERKLTYITSTKREKLFTIMYTIGNYCIEPNVNLKRIILFIIKFEIIRNDLINKIIKMNRQHKRCDVLDCLTSDMLLSGLGYFLSPTDIRTISKNIAYYFTKIFYV